MSGLIGAEDAARAAAEQLQLPVIANGQGRGILPAGHPLLVTRARSIALGEADLVLVAGTPLDFRLGYGQFGGKNGTPPARVVHLADAADQLATHCELAGSAAGDLSTIFGWLRRVRQCTAGSGAGLDQDWLPRLQQAAARAVEADAALLRSDASPIHPLRIYGELAGLLEPDAVVIGDGGDFVSYAGKYVEPQQPGGWLDPGPVRLPRHRPWLRDRGQGGPAGRSGGAAARRRRGRLLAHGRRHPGPAPPAGGDDLRQQRDLGSGEAPDAGAVRLRRRRRPPAWLPLRPGGHGARRRAASW